MTDPVGKEAVPSIKWACLTQHHWAPSLAIQRAGARAWGAARDMHQGMDISTTYTDDVRGMRTTNWPAALPQRALLFDALAINSRFEQEVYFRSPYCLGFSAKHLRDTAARIWDAGAGIYIQTEDVLLMPGDELDDIVAAALRERKAAEMRDHRAKKAREG
jgi:hypothetical protein